MNKDRAITQRLVQHAEKRGMKGLFITVDAPQLGRREKVWLPVSFLYGYSEGRTHRYPVSLRLTGHEDEIRG